MEENERASLLNELKTIRGRAEEIEAELGFCAEDHNGAESSYCSENNEFFRTLIDTIPDLVWVKDLQGVYLACNEAFELFFGAAESKIVGKTDYDFVDKKLADFFRMNDKKAMKSARPSINEEWITIAATGKRTLVETIKTPVENEACNVIGILGVARDITDRKLTEDGLKKQLKLLTQPSGESAEIEFADLFDINDIQRLQDEFSDATGVASILCDPTGNPITKPSCFCPLCSIIRETVKGNENCRKSDAALGRPKRGGPSIHLCLSGGLWDAGAAITVGGTHVANWLIGQVRDENHTEEDIRAYAREVGADEELVAVAFHSTPSMSHKKFRQISRVLYTLASQLSDIAYQNIRQARFIHDLTVTESKLNDTRNYLSSIIDSMPSLLIGVDVNCKVTQWNAEAQRTTGFSVQEALGRSLYEVLPRIKTRSQSVDAAIVSKTPSSFSLETSQKGGSVKYENVTAYPLVADGVEGAVLRVDDITERINMEKMMIQSEKMLSVGGLAAGMAHEINNPLAGILGAVSNIKKRIFSDIKANGQVAEGCRISLDNVRNYLREREIPRMLDGIQESGTRAANIVHNMLSFSRKSEMDFQKHDLIELLEKTLELAASDYDLKKQYDFKAIDVVRDYDHCVPPVMCEKNELLQVFLNIFKNGAEAMAEKDYIDGRARFVCRVKRDDSFAVIQIEDNGPGMNKEPLKRIFDPFYTTKQVGQGTGLGLSVSYFIIAEHHNGMLKVDSEPGKWTRFTIRLPL